MTENIALRALRAATCSPVSARGWFVLDGDPLEMCTLCLDSAVEGCMCYLQLRQMLRVQ